MSGRKRPFCPLVSIFQASTGGPKSLNNCLVELPSDSVAFSALALAPVHATGSVSFRSLSRIIIWSFVLKTEQMSSKSLMLHRRLPLEFRPDSFKYVLFFQVKCYLARPTAYFAYRPRSFSRPHSAKAYGLRITEWEGRWASPSFGWIRRPEWQTGGP